MAAELFTCFMVPTTLDKSALGVTINSQELLQYFE